MRLGIWTASSYRVCGISLSPFTIVLLNGNYYLVFSHFIFFFFRQWNITVPGRVVKITNKGKTLTATAKSKKKHLKLIWKSETQIYVVEFIFWSKRDLQRVLDYTLFTQKQRNAVQSRRIGEFKTPRHRKQQTITSRNLFDSKCKENTQKPTYNHAINYRWDSFLIRMSSPCSVYG